MKKILSLALLFACGAAEADSLKTGLWQVSIIKRVRDGEDVTDKMALRQQRLTAALAKLSPEQREQLGKRGLSFGANGLQVCVSPAMAAGDRPLVDPTLGCDPTKVSRSGSTYTYAFSCNRDGRSTIGTGKTTVNGGTGSSVLDVTSKDGEATHTTHMETAMKYLGSDCQGVKPLDQVSRHEQKQPAH